MFSAVSFKSQKAYILSCYLLALFKGSSVSVEHPTETPVDRFNNQHWNDSINYNYTDWIVFMANCSIINEPFAQYIDQHISCDTCPYSDKDNAMNLDEILIKQNDSDYGDDLAECNFEDAIRQRCTRFAKSLSRILTNKDYHKMEKYFNRDDTADAYAYDCDVIPSESLMELIKRTKPTARKKMHEEDAQESRHMDHIFITVLSAIAILIAIIISASATYYHMHPNSKHVTHKPNVQTYINRHYGQYHLPQHVSNIQYDPKDQDLAFRLTKYASSQYLKYPKMIRQSLQQDTNNIANHSNDSHIGSMLISSSNDKAVIKRDPSQERTYKQAMERQAEEKRQQDDEEQQQEQQNRPRAIFIPPATE